MQKKKAAAKKIRQPMRRAAHYGWIPDHPDIRDHAYAPPVPEGSLPASVDLTSVCPPTIYAQGHLGSCSANAVAAAVQFNRIKQKLAQAAELTPSRLYIYYNARVMLNAVKDDTGAPIRDVIKTVAKLGVCFENVGPGGWSYETSKFARKPSAGCYKVGKKNQTLQYKRIAPTLAHLKGCLASGFPFVFGFTVYKSFASRAVVKTGIVPMPKHEPVVGAHAVLAVGYDDASKRFKIRNSFGPDWGDRGHCWMPYDYLTHGNLADDFWTIRLVES